MLFIHVPKIVNVLGVAAQQGAPDCGQSLRYDVDENNAKPDKEIFKC